MTSRFLFVQLALGFLFAAAPVSAEDISVAKTAQLILRAEKSVDDAQGWAFDLQDVLQQHGLPQSRENICAVIAVVDQESGFVADPAVPGLGKLSEAALRAKLDKIPVGGAMALRWLENNPSPNASFLARIRQARTERDLDLVYRALVDYAGKASSLDIVFKLGLLNQMIEERNEIDTAGSMQVSVKFALDDARKRRWLPMTLTDIYGVRDHLYTREGGMYYGIKQLLAFDTGYAQKLFRFADYNAGRYASRNAAFQTVVAKLSGTTLALDGDLLRYGKDGKALSATTATEQAIVDAMARHRLNLDRKAVRADLLQEKSAAFTTTRTFTLLRDQFAKVTKTKPPFAVLPDITLNSPKLIRGFTTRRFAENVNKRYQGCMKAK